MSLGETIRERLILFAGGVAGVDCPNCRFRSRDVDVEAHTITNVTCPECGTEIRSEDQKAQLQRAGKL